MDKRQYAGSAASGMPAAGDRCGTMDRILIWFCGAVALFVLLWFLASLLFGPEALRELVAGGWQ